MSDLPISISSPASGDLPLLLNGPDSAPSAFVTSSPTPSACWPKTSAPMFPTPRTTDVRSGRGAVKIGNGYYRPSKHIAAGILVGQANLADRSRVFSDIRTLSGHDEFAGVSLVTGGFPCQPFSCAGKRRGTADDRHLWPEMLRVIAEARPAWVLGENVAGIINMELDTVLSDLEGIGYACRPFVIPACGVDARHRRNRVWIVAHRDEPRSQGRNGKELRKCAAQRAAGARDSSLADTAHNGHARRSRLCPDQQCALSAEQIHRCGDSGWTGESCRCGEDRPARWLPEPDVGRVAHGIPARVDRLRGLGNAIVPQVAFQILSAIRAQIRNGKAESR
jgi:DNA (cytosine-5)-methyltransferase 1